MEYNKTTITKVDSDIVQMQESHDLFIASLMLLLNTCKNFEISEKKTQMDNIEKMIVMLSDHNVDAGEKGALIKKIFMILDINYELLINNDDKLFNLYTTIKKKIVRVTIIPSLDFGYLWSKADTGSREKIWDYVKLLYISSSHMINSSGNNNNVTNPERIMGLKNAIKLKDKEIFNEFWKVYPSNTIVTKKEFNPFEGIGQDHKEYALSDLLSGPKLLPEQTSPGIEGITKLLGLDKMINFEDLANQLKNITKEQIENATQSIKSLLGDVDENTSEMIDLMLTDITDELKKEELGTGNPINNLVKIAENVADKMLPKINSKKVDMAQVWNSTRNMASKCQDKDGKPIFDGPNNPLAMVTNLLEKQMNINQFNVKNKNNKKKPKVPTEEEYTKECEEIFNQLGLKNISPDAMKNLKLNDIL